MNEIDTGIDFADSELNCFEMNNSNLTLELKSWDENTIFVTFSDVIQFSYKLGDGISGLYKNDELSDFLNEALHRNYTTIPKDNPYSHYIVNDTLDFPFIEVVAANVSAVKVKRNLDQSSD